MPLDSYYTRKQNPATPHETLTHDRPHNEVFFFTVLCHVFTEVLTHSSQVEVAEPVLLSDFCCEKPLNMVKKKKLNGFISLLAPVHSRNVSLLLLLTTFALSNDSNSPFFNTLIISNAPLWEKHCSWRPANTRLKRKSLQVISPWRW